MNAVGTDIPDDLPEDLRRLLDELRAARQGSTDGADTASLIQRIRQWSRRHLAPEDGLRAMMDSEDLAQDVFVDLIGAVDDFRGKTWPEFFAFTLALVKRRKIDEARYQKPRGKVQFGGDDRATGKDSSTQDPTPSMQAMNAEDRQRLHALVDQLDEPYRDALRLRLDGQDYDGIATALRVSSAAARKRVSRALAILRERW